MQSQRDERAVHAREPLHSSGVTPGQSGARWHAALAYALLGPPTRDLPEPGGPRIEELVAGLAAEYGGIVELRQDVARAQRAGTWPYRVPDELRLGLGPAQFAAAWDAVVRTLGPTPQDTRPVIRDRALTPDERRLLADRPPHHGD